MAEIDYVTLLTALIALLWTVFQQYKINSMCYECPFRKEASQHTPVSAEEK